jgi:hypothetical protein
MAGFYPRSNLVIKSRTFFLIFSAKIFKKWWRCPPGENDDRLLHEGDVEDAAFDVDAVEDLEEGRVRRVRGLFRSLLFRCIVAARKENKVASNRRPCISVFNKRKIFFQSELGYCYVLLYIFYNSGVAIHDRRIGNLRSILKGFIFLYNFPSEMCYFQKDKVFQKHYGRSWVRIPGRFSGFMGLCACIATAADSIHVCIWIYVLMFRILFFKCFKLFHFLIQFWSCDCSVFRQSIRRIIFSRNLPT